MKYAYSFLFDLINDLILEYVIYSLSDSICYLFTKTGAITMIISYYYCASYSMYFHCLKI